MQDDPRDIPYFDGPYRYDLSKKQTDELKYVKNIGDWKILIIPSAHYEVTAKVLNKKSYFYGIDAVISPQDLGVAWGPFYKGNEYKKIKTYYETRKLNYDFQSLDSRYVKSHAANIHLIPKNNEILKKLKKLRKGDSVYLRGYIVKLEGKNISTKESYSGKSSLIKYDLRNGTCENLYVTDVIYHHEKYKK